MSPGVAHEFGPRRWALVGFFTLSVVASAAVVTFFGLSAVIVVAAPVGGTWAYSRSARVTIDRHGVRFGSSSCGWADIEATTSRWGTSLRSRAGVPRQSRLVVFFPMYLADWPSHPLSRDLRRWAPHLSLPG